jgi:two-component system OmpR family response regulator
MYALLIADDRDETAIYSMALQRAGLAVSSTRDIDLAMQSWLKRPADIILVALPGHSPQKLVRQVRAEANVPLVIVVDPATERVQCELLILGADLVIIPPYSIKLLIAQIGVLMRRTNTVPTFSLPTLSVPGFQLDPTTRTVEVEGKVCSG